MRRTISGHWRNQSSGPHHLQYVKEPIKTIGEFVANVLEDWFILYQGPYSIRTSTTDWRQPKVIRVVRSYFLEDEISVPGVELPDHKTGWGVMKDAYEGGQGFSSILGAAFFGHRDPMGLTTLAEKKGLDGQLPNIKAAVRHITQAAYEIMEESIPFFDRKNYWVPGHIEKPKGLKLRHLPTEQYCDPQMAEEGVILLEDVLDRLTEILWLRFDSDIIRYILEAQEIVGLEEDEDPLKTTYSFK